MEKVKQKQIQWFRVAWINGLGIENMIPVTEEDLPKYVEVFLSEGRSVRILDG